ncbi:MAG: pectinesterase family protein [Anaeroplasma sp.]
MQYILNDSLSINETLKKCIPGDIIYLKKGVYKEKVEIMTDSIQLIGEDKNSTIITNHDFYHKIMPDNNECNTFRTYTLYAGCNNITIKNITIKNSSVPSSKYGQAVALHADGNNFVCENVILESAQDTLFTGPLPDDLIERHNGFLNDIFRKNKPSFQLYKNCIIKGDVDFIFGCAQALFIKCDLISINKANTKPDGYICAPAHSFEAKYGYLFYKCNLLHQENVDDVYLARPWRDYGTAAFIDCNLGNHINKKGFDKWNNTNRDKTARFYEYTTNQDLSLRESWVKILNKSEAQKYLHDYFEYVGYKE